MVVIMSGSIKHCLATAGGRQSCNCRSSWITLRLHGRQNFHDLANAVRFLTLRLHFLHLRREAVGYRGQTTMSARTGLEPKEAFSPTDLLHEPRRLLG